MYNQVRIIIRSDIVPNRILFADRDINFMEYSNKILDEIKISNNTLNIFIASTLGCFYKLDTVYKKPIMVYEGYYYDSDKRLTDTLGKLANDDTLYCSIFEGTESDLDEFEIKLDRDILRYQQDHIAINIYNYYDDYAIVNNKQSQYYKERANLSSKKMLKSYYYHW